jgi:hypothetical protein
VTEFETLGEWAGGSRRYAVTCDSGCVVMVQKGGAEGMVIGAAQKK